MSRTLTFEDVIAAVELYSKLPAATFFKGNTGFALLVEGGVEKVGPITSGSGIWKPGYFFITGGEKRGRRPIGTEDVSAAVEEFKKNELLAMLRVTTGRGIMLAHDIPTLVDARNAQSEVSFELEHFGGRSIIPRLEVSLSKVQDPAIKWQSGFLYGGENNRPLVMGRGLILSRILADAEFESPEAFARVWKDVEREVTRLMLLNCDSNFLPQNREGGRSDAQVRVFLSQELTPLLLGVAIADRKPGYEYSARQDVVVVQRSIRRNEMDTKGALDALMEAFLKECMRVYMMYCKSLSEQQKSKLGRPISDAHGLISAATGSFDRDSKRSGDSSESLIMWRSDSRKPHFPFEGWTPEKGKSYFVFCHGWGNGFRVSPGNPRYEWRFKNNGDGTYSKVEIRIEYDGTEKKVPGSKSAAVPFKSREEYRDGSWYSKELVITGERQGYIVQTCQDTKNYYAEQVSANGLEVKEVRLHDRAQTFGFRRIVVAESFSLQRSSGYDSDYRKPDCNSIRWSVVGSAHGEDGDDKLDISGSVTLTWAGVPDWLKSEHEAKYPLCKCGRERYIAASETECNHCRTYGDCPYCGEPDAYMGDWKREELICSDCKHGRDLVNKAKYSQGDRWNQTVALAKQLVAGQRLETGEVELETGVYALRAPVTWDLVEKIAGFEQMTPKVQAELLNQIFKSEYSSGTDFNRQLDLAFFKRESETSLKNLEGDLVRLRQQWDATAGQGNPKLDEKEPSGGKQAHWDEHWAKEFLLAEYGRPYNQLGNSASRHGKLYWAKAILAGDWQTVCDRPFSANGIQWLKEHWSESTLDPMLEAFRATPDIHTELQQFGLDERRLQLLAGQEYQRFDQQRSADFWASLGRGGKNSGEAMAEIQDEPKICLEPAVTGESEPEEPANGLQAWRPAEMKHWYLCPKGHSEKLKNAKTGQKYECPICGLGYSYVIQ